MRIACVVQHHPSRAHLLPALLAALDGAQVVADPGAAEQRRSPWRGYVACLEAMAPATTHLCVIQDDAEVCREFPQALELIARTKPDSPVCLFVPGVGGNRRRVLEACAREERYCRLDPFSWVPVVAVLWPRACVECLLSFAEGYGFKPTDTSDDANVGIWARKLGVPVWACVPSLVNHADREPSLVGKQAFGGRNPSRVAACWLGPDLAALDLEWC